MTARPTYKVKQVAQLTGVSIRALHHYDEIGLLVPSQRSAAGYRLYDEADLLRLQQISIGRELGLSLEAIRRSLDDPGFDLERALRAQRAELATRVERAAAMIRAVDEVLAALESKQGGGEDMKPEGWFDGFEPQQHVEEAERRWGNTDTYRISMERTKRYSKADWERFRAEQEAIYGDAAAALQSGAAPDSGVAMDIAERARLAIERWFYPCSHAMHERLADLYESDPRFAENIDKYAEGLTPFLAAAIRANARRELS